MVQKLPVYYTKPMYRGGSAQTQYVVVDQILPQSLVAHKYRER
jgi:hypothetical protein